MQFSRSRPTVTQLLGVVSILALAHCCVPTAHAGTVTRMEFSINNGAWTPLSPGDSTFGSVAFAGLNVTALDNPAKLFGSASTVMNTGTKDVQIQLTIGALGYDAPVGQTGHVTSILSGNFAGSPTVQFQTFFSTGSDNSHALTTLPSAGSTGLQNGILDSVDGSYTTGKASQNIGALASPYSIVQELTLTLHPGDWVQFDSNAQILAAHEPSAVQLFGFGLAGFVGFICFRASPLIKFF